MKCPKCRTEMEEREGKFGPFLFCPRQAKCGQKTVSKQTWAYARDSRARPKHYERPQPAEGALEVEMRRGPLYLEAVALEGSMGDMARMAYGNEREYEHTRDRAQVDGNQVLFGGGMFCDMGMEDDDEDQRPW